MEEIKVSKLGEVVYHETLENGLNVYLYKKEGFNKKSAYFVTKYGSSYNDFRPIGKDKIKSFPLGIAHFLEHKLFENSDNENTFTKFEKYGANVNAYTSRKETCYYFTCSSNFNECLNLLLDFVGTPYFTIDNVEKEKGIIEQEINMTNDSVERFLYDKDFYNTLMYDNNKYSVIGDSKNVRKITKEDLYECYNTFYNPSNMTLVVAGDIDVEETLKSIKDNQSKREYQKQDEILLKDFNEPKEVYKEYEECYKNVSTPRISVCYKFVFPESKGYDLLSDLMIFSMLLDIKFSSTSSFSKYLRDEKIIKSDLSMNYSSFGNVVLLMFDADVLDKERFVKELDKKLKDENYDKKMFELYKKAYIASVVKTYDSPSKVANAIYSHIINYGEFLPDIYDFYNNYTYDKFISDVKKLDFSNKSVIYVTSGKEVNNA